MGIESDINKYLKQMHKTSSVDKGNIGEKAVLKVCEELYQKGGGILYHSFTYKTDSSQAGNIKRHDGKFYIENTGNVTEIDVLLVTEYRVFVLEVKAYKAKQITLTDEGISGCAITDKSPVHQNEMHCRHLYPSILRALPDGCSKYIVPVVIFVDNCTVTDNRSDTQKNYIYVSTLNQLESCLNTLNRPLDYRIDLDVMDKCLSEICVSYEKKFAKRKRGI